jgi:hypothetical protein
MTQLGCSRNLIEKPHQNHRPVIKRGWLENPPFIDDFH